MQQRSEANGALLVAGMLAGPVYVVTSLTEALTRDGFDLTRHAWSVLANGDLGWIHVANLIVSGLLVIAGATGLRDTTSPAASVLLGVYGASMVAAGIFRADPAPGFPVGTTSAAPGAMSWHGMLHFVAGGIGFTCLVVACLIIGRRYARDSQPGWAWFSRITGVVFGVAFLGLAGGGGQPWAIVGFTVAVVLASAWLAAISLRALARTGTLVNA